MTMEKIRLDKWLWAARFFKTRAKAKQAIEGGKVHMNGVRGKPSKEIRIGDELQIRQGWDEKAVLVTALSEQRRGAQQAALLYAETAQSIQQREEAAEKRKSLSGLQHHPDGKPSKKERRLLHRFKDKNLL
jgi:ribosome-associated heat shock protein Hsp15